MKRGSHLKSHHLPTSVKHIDDTAKDDEMDEMDVMKQFQVLLNLATSARGKVVSPPCAPMSTMLHGSGSNSWENF